MSKRTHSDLSPCSECQVKLQNNKRGICDICGIKKCRLINCQNMCDTRRQPLGLCPLHVGMKKAREKTNGNYIYG